MGPSERRLPAGAASPALVPAMEVLRRSSVLAAEIMDAFDRSPTDKELVAQAKALGREFVHARLLRAGLSWSAPERAAPVPGGRLAEVCAVLLRLGECGRRPAGGVPRMPLPAGPADTQRLGYSCPCTGSPAGGRASVFPPGQGGDWSWCPEESIAQGARGFPPAPPSPSSPVSWPVLPPDLPSAC